MAINNGLKPNYHLYNHQQIALSLLEAHDYFMLAMEQGTGKTIPTLCRILADDIQTALIVAPKATMGAWTRDIDKFDDTSREILLKKVTIINYDMVWRREEYDREWDCVVLDESHFIKNRTARRSEFLLRLALKATFRYCLTGTPIGNGRLEDIWAQFAFMSPMPVYGNRVGSVLFDGAYSKFLKKYCALNQFYQPYRYFKVDEIQEIIDDNSFRILKSECLDLPDKLPEEYWDIELADKKQYKELHDFSTLEELKLLAENPLVRRAKLRQVCSGFIHDEFGKIHPIKNNKLKVLDEFLDSYDKKLVIFCHFRRSILSVSELLTKRKIKHVLLYGDTKNKEVWKDFQEDESIQVIVCQYQSASSGIDLHAADTILFYEPTDSSTTYEQCKDRIHRIGTVNKCSYICFRTTATIEVAMYKALQNFADFSDSLFTEYITDWQRSYAT